MTRERKQGSAYISGATKIEACDIDAGKLDAGGRNEGASQSEYRTSDELRKHFSRDHSLRRKSQIFGTNVKKEM